MPDNHRMYIEWDKEYILQWAHQVGESTHKVVNAIYGYLSCLETGTENVYGHNETSRQILIGTSRRSLSTGLALFPLSTIEQPQNHTKTRNLPPVGNEKRKEESTRTKSVRICKRRRLFWRENQ